jgi:hypothetical protein
MSRYWSRSEYRCPYCELYHCRSYWCRFLHALAGDLVAAKMLSGGIRWHWGRVDGPTSLNHIWFMAEALKRLGKPDTPRLREFAKRFKGVGF